MDTPVQLFGKPDFYAEGQEDLFKLKQGKKIEIPGVYVNKYGEQKDEEELIFDYGFSWKESEDGKKWTRKYEIVTKMDLLNFRGLDEDGIYKLLKSELNIDINTESGIDELNSLLHGAIEFLDKVGKRVPEKYGQGRFFFESKEDVIHFCELTTTSNKAKAYMNCILSKSMGVVHDIISNKGLEDLEKKKDFLVEKIRNRPEFEFYPNTENKGHLKIGEKKIEFTMIPREKSILSSMIKIGNKPEYFSSKLINDGIGFTFYIENKDDSLLFLQYLSGILYEGKFTLQNKGFIDVDKYNDLSKDLNPQFIQGLNLINEEKKTGSGKKYSDLKASGKVNVPHVNDMWMEGAVGDDVGVEIKIDTYDSKNDNGLSFHPIYNYIKYLELQCRLFQGYISESEIEYISNLFFIELNENIRKKNKLLPEEKQKTREQYLKELEKDLVEGGYTKKTNKSRRINSRELKDGLKKYYCSKLKKVKVGGGHKKYYTTQREYNLSLVWYRQPMKIIN